MSQTIERGGEGERGSEGGSEGGREGGREGERERGRGREGERGRESEGKRDRAGFCGPSRPIWAARGLVRRPTAGQNGVLTTYPPQHNINFSLRHKQLQALLRLLVSVH